MKNDENVIHHIISDFLPSASISISCVLNSCCRAEREKNHFYNMASRHEKDELNGKMRYARDQSMDGN